MKYFYDTEFLEGAQRKRFLGIPYGKTKPTIDLISIGIVSEDGREYYAVSKDFNLKEAWNRYDLKLNKDYPQGPKYIKEYWIRKNILKHIFVYLFLIDHDMSFNILEEEKLVEVIYDKMTYRWLKKLIRKLGKSNKQIAEEVKVFILTKGKVIDESGYCKCSVADYCPNNKIGSQNRCKVSELLDNNVEIYGYYSDYDHVALCWLFGKMIDLPKGFPMYTIDLKQIIDDYPESKNKIIKWLTDNKPVIKHSAIDDARWNKELYEYLKTYK